MKGFRHMVTATALLALGTVMTGCYYYPHDRGYHRGEYEHERGDYQRRDKGDHDRGDRHDRGRGEYERDQGRGHEKDRGRDHNYDHKGDHERDRDHRD